MACTACASECLCSVIGQFPVTVTGSGSGLDPYIVSVDLCAYLGLLAAPVRESLSSDAIYVRQIDGTCLLVNPKQETPFTGIEGRFIDITPGGVAGHAPTFDVLVSTDPGNQVATGTDLGLYVPGSFSQAGSPCITVTGAGTAANPYIFTPVVNPDPTNALSCGPNGLFVAPEPAETPNTKTDTTTATVTLSGPLGRNIQVDVQPVCAQIDGQIPQGAALPLVVTTNGAGACALSPFPAPAAPLAGCGINVVGTTISAKTLPWTYPCADSNGAPVICDGAGNLRTMPEHTCVSGGRQGTDLQIGAGTPAGTYDSPPANSTINNPSQCRSMMVVSDYSTSSEIFDTSGVTNASVSLNVITGISYIGVYPHHRQNPSTASFGTGWLVHGSNDDIGTIGPAGSVTVSITSRLIFSGALNAGGASISASALVWGCTQ